MLTGLGSDRCLLFKLLFVICSKRRDHGKSRESTSKRRRLTAVILDDHVDNHCNLPPRPPIRCSTASVKELDEEIDGEEVSASSADESNESIHTTRAGGNAARSSPAGVSCPINLLLTDDLLAYVFNFFVGEEHEGAGIVLGTIYLRRHVSLSFTD